MYIATLISYVLSGSEQGCIRKYTTCSTACLYAILYGSVYSLVQDWTGIYWAHTQFGQS